MQGRVPDRAEFQVGQSSNWGRVPAGQRSMQGRVPSEAKFQVGQSSMRGNDPAMAEFQARHSS